MRLPDREATVLAHSHAIAAADAPRDTPLRLLMDSPDAPLGCLPYQPLPPGSPEHLVPVFLSTPDYVAPVRGAARVSRGDRYDYARVARYATNSGWAAGTTRTEATVHALNQIIERDAMALHPPRLGDRRRRAGADLFPHEAMRP